MFTRNKIDTHIEKVLATSTVHRAQNIMRARSGMWCMAGISFIESSLPLPILTDPFLIAAILADRKNALILVLITISASIAGGVFAYLTALFFFESIVGLMTPELMQQFQSVIESNTANTFVLSIVGAITPIPYTLVAWAVAVIEGSFLAFLVASVFGRGLRYGIVGFCVYKFGPLAVSYARRYLWLTSVLVFGLVVLYVYLKM